MPDVLHGATIVFSGPGLPWTWAYTMQGEPAVFRAVELVASDDITWDLGLRDTACYCEGVEPHDCECHDLNDHAGVCVS